MENLVSAPQFISFFKNKKVFITGHTGFKGSWLSAVLHRLGAIVKGYALEPSYNGGLFGYIQPLGIVESVIADIRERERLFKELKDFEPDIVFHLAAQPLVRRSYEIPAETFEINVGGTANLLESVHNITGRCSIIVVTTDKVYHNKESDILYREEDVLGGYDPYSASKACAELLADSFRRSFFNPETYSAHGKSLATARAGNVIGGGDFSKDRIIPDIIRSLKNNQTVVVRNPEAIRPWQHVLEAISGYLLLAEKLDSDPAKYGKAYNFGPIPDDHYAVKYVVDRAIDIWGSGDWRDASDSSDPHEAGVLKLDINRAVKELSWQPRLNANDAIEWTIKWYKKSDNEKTDYAFKQVDDYFHL